MPFILPAASGRLPRAACAGSATTGSGREEDANEDRDSPHPLQGKRDAEAPGAGGAGEAAQGADADDLADEPAQVDVAGEVAVAVLEGGGGVEGSDERDVEPFHDKSQREKHRPADGFRVQAQPLPQHHPALRPGGAFGFRGHGFEAGMVLERPLKGPF